jgi:large subunit ribosomal protein L1
MRLSKRRKEINNRVDTDKAYSIDEAVELLQSCPEPKFNESLEFSMKLGIDPKKSDQMVRGNVFLPHGTGKQMRIAVFAKGDKAEEAKAAGADIVGEDDLFDKINGGWFEFDALIATPDMMRLVGRLGKILGPRNLMPTPKAGTVTLDVKRAVEELKAGRVEFKNNKMGVVNVACGKRSFTKEQLAENVRALIAAIVKAKPPSAKGYIQSLALSTTMGPGLAIQSRELAL